MTEKFGKPKPEDKKTGVQIEEEIMNRSFIGHKGKDRDELGAEWQAQQDKITKEEQARSIQEDFEQDEKIRDGLIQDRSKLLEIAKVSPLNAAQKKELDFVTNWLKRDYPELLKDE